MIAAAAYFFVETYASGDGETVTIEETASLLGISKSKIYAYFSFDDHSIISNSDPVLRTAKFLQNI